MDEPHNKKVDFVNANGAEFKNYVLYIIPGEANSEKALQMVRAAGNDDVWVQDLRMLHPPLPGWLNGVPTLVPRSEARAYKGSDCLELLERVGHQPQGYLSGQTQSVARTFEGAGSVTRFEVVGGPGGAGLGAQQASRDIDGRVNERDIESYMQQRTAQTEMFKQDPQANAIVAT